MKIHISSLLFMLFLFGLSTNISLAQSLDVSGSVSVGGQTWNFGGNSGGSNSESCNGRGFSNECLFPGGNKITGVLDSANSSDHTGTILAYFPVITDIMLKFIAPILFVMLVYSGFMFIFGAGNDETLQKAKDFFLNAIIGLLAVVLSWSIMKIVYYLFI